MTGALEATDSITRALEATDSIYKVIEQTGTVDDKEKSNKIAND